jgi:alcohol dehydrogenase (cytochrome c)
MYYLTETDPRGAMGLGGKDEVGVGTMGSFISAIDYKTGKTVWKHKFRTAGRPRGAPGLLTTAGKLLFGGDVSGQLRRVRSGQRQAAVALADRSGDERA